MTKRVLILVPKLDLSGPTRGALALLAGLKTLGVDVQLLPLKVCHEFEDDSINRALSEKPSLITKIQQLLEIIEAAEGTKTVLISFCLQADLIAFIVRKKAAILSSVRGNLYQNYTDDFGLKGYLIAFAQYRMLRFFPAITALNRQMMSDLSRHNQNVELVPNFIDEQSISTSLQKPKGVFKFVFVGSLSRRKAILELISAFKKCLDLYPDTELHVVGNGPLERDVKTLIQELNLSDAVKLHGFISEPLEIVKKCDVFVLPSYSEGISRAAMEALYLGKRCIMQNVDGNKELIVSDTQGTLISDISFLSDALMTTRKKGREEDFLRLPVSFRQISCSERYIEIIDRYFSSEIGKVE